MTRLSERTAAMALAGFFGLCASVLLTEMASADGARTVVRVLSPFGVDGLHRDLSVTARLVGTCWSGSASAAGRLDAWRCMAGNRVFDPCFRAPGGLRVACVSSPFSHSVTLLSLDSPLARENGEASIRRQPWALRLANGAKCTFLTGASSSEGGMRANYGCTKGTVFGDIDHSGSTWQVYYATSQDDSNLLQVDVVEAVF